jgi:hypothetical protein
MKNIFYCLFILVLFSNMGCKEEPEPEQVRIEECVGSSFYYLDNQSSRSFFVEFLSPPLNNQKDTVAINVRQKVLIGQDASFGYIPRPADTFSNFTIYTLVNGKKNILYKQDPVANALWTKQKENLTDPDFGCQQVYYTLTITDDLLK